MVRVALALGSNLGDRRGHLQFALAELARHLSVLQASQFRETEPLDVPGPQPAYLNAAVIGETALEAEPLLDVLLAIERAAGRRRTVPRGPRTLDLDLILFGDRVVHTPALTVPHPRFRERPFVLEPLAELAPDWRDPVSQKTIAELWKELRASSS